jgi:TM2 domain-containing membrane protein YozV
MKLFYAPSTSRPIVTICQYLLLFLSIDLGACQRSIYSFQRVAEPERPSVALAPDVTRALVVAPARQHLPVVSAVAQPRPRVKHRVRPALAPVRKVRSLLTLKAAAQAVRAQVVAHPLHDSLPPSAPVYGRSRGVAFLLAFLLGATGAHLFYLGYNGRGLTYLLLTVAAIVLLSIGAVGFVAALFGGGGSFLTLLLLGAILASVVSTLALIDAILILTGALRPRNGEYYPRFFQTRP